MTVWAGLTPQYWTQTVYDALGRVTQTIPPDGTVTANYIGASYSVNITTITDQTGRQTRQYADAFGRLTRVDEPALAGVPAGTAQGSVSIVGNTDKSVTNGGAPATSGTGSVTFSGVEEIICGIRCTPDTGTLQSQSTVRHMAVPRREQARPPPLLPI